MEKIEVEMVKKPWGKFETFCTNTPCTVKVLTVEPHQSLSLQYHNKRAEFWRVLDGEAEFIIADKRMRGSAGDEFFIPQGTKHRIITGDSFMRWLELSFGEFDETDIVRLEDAYGRQGTNAVI